MKEVKLPKYFIIKQCNDPLWDDYIKWLNKTYSVYYEGTSSFDYYGYDGNGRNNGTNNWDNLHNFENKPEIITLEYWNQCINQLHPKTQMTQKLTVKVTEVLKIHEVACPSWKATISSYLARIDKDQNITFFPEEIKCMFKASNINQLHVLEEVFGKEEVVIEYDRLQTGSIVKLHPNKKGQLVGDNRNMDLSKAVNIVFANTPHSIDCWGKFVKKCYYDSYYTFEQDGIFARYSTKELDYIAEVIEY
jgi:hypothetical protein